MKYFFTLLLFSFSFLANGQLATPALLFDGVNDLATIPANAAYQPGTADFTIEFWFRSVTPAGGAASNCVLLSTRNTNLNGIELFLLNGRPGVFINGNWVSLPVNGNPDYRDSVCHHLAVRRTNGLVNLFVDGLLKLSQSLPAAVSSGTNLVIGGRNASGSYGYLKGIMKEVRFWNRSLLQSEIIDGFNKVYTNTTPNLIGYWRLNATSGQLITDYSVNVNNGQLGTNSTVETTDPGFSTGCPSCAQTPVFITPATSTAICAGDSVLLNATNGVGYQYQWYKNAVAISGATASSYYAKNEASYSVRLTNASGCISYSPVVNVTVPIEQFRNLTSSAALRNGNVCLNGGQIFLYEPTVSGASYQWYKDNILIAGANSPSLSVATSAPGVYSCQVTSGGCSLRSSVANAKSFAVTISSSVTQFCQDTAYLSPTFNFSPYTSGVWRNNTTQVGTGFSFFTSQSGYYNYYLLDTFTCSTPLTSNYISINAGTSPALKMFPAPVVSSVNGWSTIDTCVNGNLFLALLATGHNEDVDTIVTWLKDGMILPYMQNTIPVYDNGVYAFSVNTNCGSSSTGPVAVRVIDYSNPPQISASANSGCPSVTLSVLQHWDAYQWNLNGVPIAGATNFTHVASQTGAYTCVMTNRCGSVTTTSRNVTITGPGAQISAAQPYSLCNGPKTLFANPPGYTYKWLLNNTVIAGATSTQYIATVGGQYRVIVTNSCKSDTSNVLNLPVETTVPLTPGTMTGATRICPGSNGIVYSIPAVATAFTYQWVIPAGVTLVGASNSTSITVNFSTSYLSGDVQVRAGNACGWGPYRTKTVRSMIPAMPGAVTGPTYGVCNSTVNYSIAAVSQATTYLWVAPAGATIVSGQGTTSVSVSYPSNYTPDTLKVSAGNSCSFGPVRKVVVRGQPLVPGSITGPSSACNGQTGVNFTISPVYGALSYTWNKPTGSTITAGQGTISATITFGPTSGNVTVKSVNACGASGNSIKAVTINCREGITDAESFEVYPNPSQIDFYLVGDFQSNEYIIQLYDMTAKQMFIKTIRESLHFGNELVPGVYILKITGADSEKNIRVVKM